MAGGLHVFYAIGLSNYWAYNCQTIGRVPTSRKNQGKIYNMVTFSRICTWNSIIVEMYVGHLEKSGHLVKKMNWPRIQY